MQDRRKRLMTERVVRDLEEAFPPLAPGRQKYVVESDKYAFYLYDSRPKDGGGDSTKTPVAKVSFLDSDISGSCHGCRLRAGGRNTAGTMMSRLSSSS